MLIASRSKQKLVWRRHDPCRFRNGNVPIRNINPFTDNRSLRNRSKSFSRRWSASSKQLHRNFRSWTSNDTKPNIIWGYVIGELNRPTVRNNRRNFCCGLLHRPFCKRSGKTLRHRHYDKLNWKLYFFLEDLYSGTSNHGHFCFIYYFMDHKLRKNVVLREVVSVCYSLNRRDIHQTRYWCLIITQKLPLSSVSQFFLETFRIVCFVLNCDSNDSPWLQNYLLKITDL